MRPCPARYLSIGGQPSPAGSVVILRQISLEPRLGTRPPMPLGPDARLGPYEIQSALGAGGPASVRACVKSAHDGEISPKPKVRPTSMIGENVVRELRACTSSPGLSFRSVC